MGRSKKDLHFGSRDGRGGVIRTSVADRTSKAARPWNDPEGVKASSTYGVKLKSYKEVHNYENTLESQGSLEPHERFTCGPCGKLNASCACKGGSNG
jgi:hypothetical protein